MTNENSLAPIKPFVTENGVELYSTNNLTGMSISGVSVFCGVQRQTIGELVQNIAAGKVASEHFKPFTGKDCLQQFPSSNGGTVTVIPSILCAAICTYYATESKAANDTARYSLGKFAAMGIDSWIRKTTGHEQASSLALTPEQMTLLLLETTQRALESESKLRITTEQLLDKERYITKATINAPGLFNILETAQEVDGCVVIEENKQYWTLIEWVEQYKGITIPEKMYRQLRLKVAGLFESLRHRTPKKEARLNPNGKTVPAYVYSKEDFHYLETVLTQVIGAYVP